MMPYTRRKIYMAALSVVTAFGVLGMAAWMGIFTPTAPADWAQVHIGISRNNVLRLAGAPSASGWPEKPVETWQRDGVICRHRLVVGYDGQQVIQVCDGTWLRGYGWLHPRIETK